MRTTEAIDIMNIHGCKVETMHVAVGNIYRCDVLDGLYWMYENVFLRKVTEYLKEEEV